MAHWKDCVTVLHNERGKERNGNYIDGFSGGGKKLIWGNMVILATIGSLNGQGMISFMITTRSLNSQGMIKIFKQSGHDFSGKRLCDGYFMDIT